MTILTIKTPKDKCEYHAEYELKYSAVGKAINEHYRNKYNVPNGQPTNAFIDSCRSKGECVTVISRDYQEMDTDYPVEEYRINWV